MKIFIEDHSLVIKTTEHMAYIVRPCASIDGTFSRKGNVMPWFRVDRSRDGRFHWTYLPLPYLLFGKVEVKEIVGYRCKGSTLVMPTEMELIKAHLSLARIPVTLREEKLLALWNGEVVAGYRFEGAKEIVPVYEENKT